MSVLLRLREVEGLWGDEVIESDVFGFEGFEWDVWESVWEVFESAPGESGGTRADGHGREMEFGIDAAHDFGAVGWESWSDAEEVLLWVIFVDVIDEGSGCEEEFVAEGFEVRVRLTVEGGVEFASSCVEASGDDAIERVSGTSDCFKGRARVEGDIEGHGEGFEHRHRDAKTRESARST